LVSWYLRSCLTVLCVGSFWFATQLASPAATDRLPGWGFWGCEKLFRGFLHGKETCSEEAFHNVLYRFQHLNGVRVRLLWTKLLCSISGPSWPVIGWTLTLPLPLPYIRRLVYQHTDNRKRFSETCRLPLQVESHGRNMRISVISHAVVWEVLMQFRSRNTRASNLVFLFFFSIRNLQLPFHLWMQSSILTWRSNVLVWLLPQSSGSILTEPSLA
jgi:hypothetical protein